MKNHKLNKDRRGLRQRSPWVLSRYKIFDSSLHKRRSLSQTMAIFVEPTEELKNRSFQSLIQTKAIFVQAMEELKKPVLPIFTSDQGDLCWTHGRAEKTGSADLYFRSRWFLFKPRKGWKNRFCRSLFQATAIFVQTTEGLKKPVVPIFISGHGDFCSSHGKAEKTGFDDLYFRPWRFLFKPRRILLKPRNNL